MTTSTTTTTEPEFIAEAILRQVPRTEVAGVIVTCMRAAMTFGNGQGRPLDDDDVDHFSAIMLRAAATQERIPGFRHLELVDV